MKKIIISMFSLILTWSYVYSQSVATHLGYTVEWADPQTREGLDLKIHPSWQVPLNLYSFDKYNVFRSGNIIKEIDVNSLQWVKYRDDYELTERVRDKDHVYYKDKKIEWSHAPTREMIRIPYAKDKNNVYYKGKILEWASPDTFVQVNKDDYHSITYIWDQLPIIEGKLIPTNKQTFSSENSIDGSFFIWEDGVYTKYWHRLKFLESNNIIKIEKEEKTYVNSDWLILTSTLIPCLTTEITDWKYFIAKHDRYLCWHASGGEHIRIALLPKITSQLDALYDNLNTEKLKKIKDKLESIKNSSRIFSVHGNQASFSDTWFIIENTNEALNFTTNEMLIYQIVNYLDEKIRYKIRSNT